MKKDTTDPEPSMWDDDDKPNPKWYEWAERHRTPEFGPANSIGVVTCHGCSITTDEPEKTEHRKGCSRTCTWMICAFHNRSMV